MEYLFSSWDKVKSRIRRRRVALFLDYDGTLTPIVQTPQEAVISENRRKILEKLVRCPACKVAIISGRSLEDIKEFVGLEGIVYSGNHGFQIEGPKIKFQSPVSARYKINLRQIKNDLTKKLARIKGAFVEDKGVTLSVHYRLAAKKSVPLVEALFKSAVKLYLARRKIRVTAGKKVFEIRPPAQWNKGRIVLWLLARQRFALRQKGLLPVYIGDDTTDEDAFRALKGKGLTVFVGRPRQSAAGYYLKDTKDVYRFLKRLLYLKKEAAACPN